MIVVTWYAIGCIALVARGHDQAAAWLLVPVGCLVIWRTAHWFYRRGWWEPGDGRARPRFWGQRW